MNGLKVINKSIFLGKEIDVYGTAYEPLFKAKGVAEWIEHSDVSIMIKSVVDDEKVLETNPNNACGGQNVQDPQHQKQTQIKWYDNLFGELLRATNIVRPGSLIYE